MLDLIERTEPVAGFALPPGVTWRRRLVCGALVSGKTRRGLPGTERYPSLREVGRMASTTSKAPVWLHYNPSRGLDEEVDQALLALCHVLAGRPEGEPIESPDGFQINAPGVAPEVMARVRANHPRTEIVMQVSREGVGSDAAADFDAYVRRYAGACDHALIDLSRGRGIPIDVEWTADLLRRYAPGWLALGIRPAIAGGLGPDSGAVLERLAGLVGPLLLECSFDAETNVCGHSGLDEERVVRYRRAIAGALRAAQGRLIAPHRDLRLDK